MYASRHFALQSHLYTQNGVATHDHMRCGISLNTNNICKTAEDRRQAVGQKQKQKQKQQIWKNNNSEYEKAALSTKRQQK